MGQRQRRFGSVERRFSQHPCSEHHLVDSPPVIGSISGETGIRSVDLVQELGHNARIGCARMGERNRDDGAALIHTEVRQRVTAVSMVRDE